MVWALVLKELLTGVSQRSGLVTAPHGGCAAKGQRRCGSRGAWRRGVFRGRRARVRGVGLRARGALCGCRAGCRPQKETGCLWAPPRCQPGSGGKTCPHFTDGEKEEPQACWTPESVFSPLHSVVSLGWIYSPFLDLVLILDFLVLLSDSRCLASCFSSICVSHGPSSPPASVLPVWTSLPAGASSLLSLSFSYSSDPAFRVLLVSAKAFFALWLLPRSGPKTWFTNVFSFPFLS